MGFKTAFPLEGIVAACGCPGMSPGVVSVPFKPSHPDLTCRANLPRPPAMAALLAADARKRAAAHVDHQHRADRESQARNHADESARLHRMREVEVRSFTANREEAIDRHRDAIKGIDRAEEHAF